MDTISHKAKRAIGAAYQITAETILAVGALMIFALAVWLYSMGLGKGALVCVVYALCILGVCKAADF